MDVISAIQVAAHTSGFGIQAFVGVAMAATMLAVEMPQRFGLPSASEVSPGVMVKSIARAAGSCIPDLGGIALIVSVAVFLRVWNPVSPSHYADPVDQQIWADIIKDWPILNGADTLLGFQAMLRLFMYLAIVLRTCSKWGKLAKSDSTEESPISGMSAMFALAGMTARVTLCTNTTFYELDGPLGANLPVACEMAMVPLVTMLALKTAKKLPAATVAAATGAAAWVASQNYLNFAANPSLDRLYTLAHVLELLGAFAFLYATVYNFFGTKRKGAFTASAIFTYIVVAVQQGLAAYYYLNAWDAETWRAITGAGRPACILLLGNLMSLGAYLVAAAMFLASYLVNADCDSNTMDTAVVPLTMVQPRETVHRNTKVAEDEESGAIFL